MQANDVIGIAIKKISSVVSGVASVVVDDTAKTITWTFTDGNTAVMTFDQPSDGVSVAGFTQIDTTHFVWDYSDGTQSAQFEIPEQYIAISAVAGNALVKKADGLYVSTTGVEISATTGNKIETKADGLYVGSDANKVDVDQTVANAGKALVVGADGMVTVGDAGVKVSTKANNLITTETGVGEEGIYVGHDSTKVDVETGKGLISDEMLAKISSNETHIGDVTTIAIASVTDLVSAVNVLYNSFMTSITYASKKLTITYRNGGTVDIDMSAIITDTNLTELNNVDDTGIQDKQVLAYDLASKKYKPFTIDTSSVLQDAKDYTDDEIAKINTSAAIACDEKPVYDGTGAKPVITYKQSGVTKTTNNVKTWFYYHDATDDKDYQTIFIDGIEFTLAVANDVDFDDYLKIANIVSTYTGAEADKTKVPNLASLDALMTLVNTELAKKINTSDIVDTLASEATDKPLSAKQGKALKDEVDGKVDKVTGKGLSTNDYTTAEKTKLAGIEEGANKTVVDSVLSDTSENPVQNKVINSALTSKVDAVYGKGLSTCDYSVADRSKLNKIEAEANKYILPTASDTQLGGVKVDTALSSTSTNPVQNKVINTAISELNQNLSKKVDNDSFVAENLLTNFISNGTYSHNDVTYTVTDGGVTSISGKASSTSYLSIVTVEKPLKIAKGKYTISGCFNDKCVLRVYKVVDATPTTIANDTGSGATFEVLEDTDISVQLRVNTTNTENGTFYPMLERGSVAHAYQPYNYSRPSLRSDISSLNENLEYVAEQNLLPFDLSTIKQLNTTGTWVDNKYSIYGVDFDFYSDGSFHVEGTATGRIDLFINKATKLKKGLTYIISDHANSILSKYSLAIREKTGSWVMATDNYNNRSIYTPIADNDNLECFYPVYKDATVNETVYPQLEKGTVAHAYKPYKNSFVTNENLDEIKSNTYNAESLSDINTQAATWTLMKELTLSTDNITLINTFIMLPTTYAGSVVLRINSDKGIELASEERDFSSTTLAKRITLSAILNYTGKVNIQIYTTSATTVNNIKLRVTNLTNKLFQ